MTRMEEYTGRGLYAKIQKPQKKLIKNKFEPNRSPTVTSKTVKQLTSFDLSTSKPKVRTVAEILEQTKVIINPRENKEDNQRLKFY